MTSPKKTADSALAKDPSKLFGDDDSINLSLWDENSKSPSLIETEPSSSLSFSLSSDSEFSFDNDQKNSDAIPTIHANNDITFVFEPSTPVSLRNRERLPGSKKPSSWYDQIFNFLDGICTTSGNTRESNLSPQKSCRRKFKNRIGMATEQMRRYHDLTENIGNEQSRQRRPHNRKRRSQSHWNNVGITASKSMDEECIKMSVKSSQRTSHILSSMNCMDPIQPLLEDLNDEEHKELCYDSDPGDFTYRKNMKLMEKRRNTSFSDVEVELIYSPSKKNSGRSRHERYADISSETDFHLINDVLAPKIVKDAMNKIENMTLHEPQEKNKATKPPARVEIWVERGTILGKKVLEPKLTWSVKNGSIEKPSSIPLMDIYRIFPVTTIDRNKYPFAKTKNSFFVKSASYGDILFEAQDEKKKNTLMRNLKLVIARLASQAFMNDTVILKDYFRDTFIGEVIQHKKKSRHMLI